MVSLSGDGQTVSFLACIVISFSRHTSLAGLISATLKRHGVNRNGERRHTCLLSDFCENNLTFSPFGWRESPAIYSLYHIPSLSRFCKTFSIRYVWTWVKAFSLSLEMVSGCWPLSPFGNELHLLICKCLTMPESLNGVNLIMADDLSDVCWNSLCKHVMEKVCMAATQCSAG